MESFFDLKLSYNLFPSQGVGYTILNGYVFVEHRVQQEESSAPENRMKIEEAPIPSRSLCTLGYRDTKACRLKWLPKGKRLRGIWKCRKKFVPKVFPPSMRFVCLPRIHVFLFLLLLLPRSFVRQDACVFKNKVRRNKYNNFMFHVDKIKMSILFSRILMNICYSYTFNYIIINFCQIVLATV